MGNPGKALLIIWLHGGITVTPQWTSMLDYEDYFRYPKADEYIVETLQKMGEKAVFLLPICHHSEKHPCRSWNDCAIDVKTIIDDYQNYNNEEEQINKNAQVSINMLSDVAKSEYPLAESWHALVLPAIAP